MRIGNIYLLKMNIKNNGIFRHINLQFINFKYFYKINKIKNTNAIMLKAETKYKIYTMEC